MESSIGHFTPFGTKTKLPSEKTAELSAAKKLSVCGTTEPRYCRTSSGWSFTASEKEQKMMPSSASFFRKVVATETESTTVRTTLAQLQLAANSYADPATRDAARERVAEGLWALAQDAEAGSDSQLQFVTAYASAASTPAQWERVAQLRSGAQELPGLEIDADLSWALLVSLAAGGVVSAAEIDEALAADNTAKGGEFAAQARAALPSVEAKRAAWQSLVDSADLPNTVVRSAAAGFVHPAGVPALREFVDAYFDMLLPVWESRTYQIAQYLIVGLYPAPLADAALRDATRGWLAEHRDAPAALRRLVNENLAGVERALSVQERDRQD